MWKMIEISDFIKFVEENFDLVSGVPCSYFKNFLAALAIQEEVLTLTHLIATREDEAVAIATGAAISRKRALVYMQNSGLGHIVDIVTSLYKPYEIPLPKMVLSVRCKPYHHSFMHDNTTKLLELLEYNNVEMIIQNEED